MKKSFWRFLVNLLILTLLVLGLSRPTSFTFLCILYRYRGQLSFTSKKIAGIINVRIVYFTYHSKHVTFKLQSFGQSSKSST